MESSIQIKCCDCQVPYIGKTGRNLSMWLTDANEGQKVATLRSHYIAEHDLKNIKSTENQRNIDGYQRLTLQSWFINL